MNYNLRKPCAKCPFRTNVKPYIRPGRVQEFVQGEFACHMTTGDSQDGGERVELANTEHCAGALIMLEKMGRPHQMMRICERLNFYDASKLDMSAPVYDSLDDMIEAHEEADNEPH